MKTIVFTRFSAHPASPGRSHFLPKPLRKHVSNHISNFDVKNHETWFKLSPKSLPRRSQNRQKIVKIQVWIQRCPKRCPQGPWVTKMDAQGSKMEPPGCQNGASGVSKSRFSIQNLMPSRGQPINCRLFSRSAVDQLPVNEGAGGRGEALRFAAPPLGGAGRA